MDEKMVYEILTRAGLRGLPLKRGFRPPSFLGLAFDLIF